MIPASQTSHVDLYDVDLYDMDDLKFMLRLGWQDWKRFGDVTAKTHGDLTLFNYTNAAQFANRWNWFERVSRGLILNHLTGEIVARPFDKFFNYNPGQPNPNKVIDITAKMDGSLGILYRYSGTYRIATRGSFTSDQAYWATEFLYQNHDVTGLDDRLTLLFEIIYPENRVVVDYRDFKGLVLIGARDRFTGEDYFHDRLKAVAEKHNFPLVANWRNTGYQIEDVLEMVGTLDANTEGWVVRYADGQRVKIKTDAYRTLHKVLTSRLSYDGVLDAMATDQFDHLVTMIPETFLPQVWGWHNEIMKRVNGVRQVVGDIWSRAPKADRKTFALFVKEAAPHHMPYFFALLDGRITLDTITPMIYKLEFKDDSKAEKAA